MSSKKSKNLVEEAQKVEEEEEDDYMSATFVDESLNKGTSLLYSRKHQVEHERYKRKIENAPKSKRSMREMEEERREEALSKPIESANKGYLLLQKMMAKSTTGTSESTVTDTSSTTQSPEDAPAPVTTETKLNELISQRAPITVDLKSDRLGLGHSTTKRQKVASSSSRISDKPEDINRRFYQNETDFRAAKLAQTTLFYARKDFQSCQNACASLERPENGGPESPLVDWYWPKKVLAATRKKEETEKEEETPEEPLEDTEEEDDTDINYLERLEELNEYLRRTYQYCVWCGTRYDSPQDLRDNCPGDSRQDHD